jgi:RNA polymerase sigma factor (sigma-70 family)
MPCPDTTHVYCVRCHRRRPARLRACCCGCRRRSRLPADAVAELCRQWRGLPSNALLASWWRGSGRRRHGRAGQRRFLVPLESCPQFRSYPRLPVLHTCFHVCSSWHCHARQEKPPLFCPLKYQPGDDGAGMDEATGAIDARNKVAELMRYLSPRQRRIIKARFYDGRELHEIAEELGICRERVRQIEKAAIGRMRGAAAHRPHRGPAPASDARAAVQGRASPTPFD